MFGFIVLFLIACKLYGQVSDKYESATSYQHELNSEYGNPETSPLDSIDLINFKSLRFYPVDTSLAVLASFKISKGKKFKMKTSGKRTPLYRKYGEVSFMIGDSLCRLNVYQNIALSKKKEYKRYLFLPFKDLTSGSTSYGGGRYLDLERPKGKTIWLDFNKAYNPYCAYSHHYSCPIPPPENFLNVEINAGVMDGLILKN